MWSQVLHEQVMKEQKRRLKLAEKKDEQKTFKENCFTRCDNQIRLGCKEGKRNQMVQIQACIQREKQTTKCTIRKVGGKLTSLM